jgi:hypothetical protein
LDAYGCGLSYKGRITDPDRIKVINNWGPCANFTQVTSVVSTERANQKIVVLGIF